MKINYQQFWLILWCWVTQIPIKQSIFLSGFSEVSGRHWFETFRLNLPQDEIILTNLVQIDETYFKNSGLLLGKQVGFKKLT